MRCFAAGSMLWPRAHASGMTCNCLCQCILAATGLPIGSPGPTRRCMPPGDRHVLSPSCSAEEARACHAMPCQTDNDGGARLDAAAASTKTPMHAPTCLAAHSQSLQVPVPCTAKATAHARATPARHRWRRCLHGMLPTCISHIKIETVSQIATTVLKAAPRQRRLTGEQSMRADAWIHGTHA